MGWGPAFMQQQPVLQGCIHCWSSSFVRAAGGTRISGCVRSVAFAAAAAVVVASWGILSVVQEVDVDQEIVAL
jgi:hypothetical protein